MRKTDSSVRPLDPLWQPPAIIWTLLVGQGLAIVLALAPGLTLDRTVYFGLASFGAVWVCLLSLAMLYVLRAPLGHLRPVHIALIALALLLLNTWLAAFTMVELLGSSISGTFPDIPELFLQLGGIALTVGALGFAAFQSHWRAQKLALQAKQSELEALQARIRPHFLFNTLNTGAALVRRQPEEVERLLLDLADLFRAALAGPRDITLEDELALARRYLEIESLRFGDRLRIEWKLPREIPRVMVPSLSIQPLVENAIRHGIERRAEGGEIEVAVSTVPGTVVVRITNPLASGGENRPGHHVGLNASQVRIEALTGGRGSVLTQQEGRRFIATVRLPTNA
ncbi:sensor histidine kinase [Lysobacter soli]|uniref:sensor histidine kinase n=1 Tax=Lysobacter soli TaxID=453783 RepID=UPI0037CAE2B9